MSDRGTPALQAGDAGAAVRDLRRRLAACGLTTSGDPPDEFGPCTEAAVRSFQEQRGLRVDGICGRDTWSELVEAGHRLGDRLLYLTTPMLRGDDVSQLQRQLGSLGFDAGRVDGIFGPDTVRALEEFQRNTGLTTDAICGPAVVAALARLGAKPDAGSPVARVREVEALRTRPSTLPDRKIVIGELGGLGSVADAAGRRVTALGGQVIVLHDPDESRQAAQANAYEADAIILLTAADGLAVAYYGRTGFESVGGRSLAELLAGTAAAALTDRPPRPRAMSVPILRETRAPAVVLELGPATTVAERAPELADAIADAVGAWVVGPAR